MSESKVFTAEQLLERCSVLFFLQCQQIAAIRESLEFEGFPPGPGTTLGTLAHMKREIQDQCKEIAEFKARKAVNSTTVGGGK